MVTDTSTSSMTSPTGGSISVKVLSPSGKNKDEEEGTGIGEDTGVYRYPREVSLTPPWIHPRIGINVEMSQYVVKKILSTTKARLISPWYNVQTNGEKTHVKGNYCSSGIFDFMYTFVLMILKHIVINDSL